MTRKYKEVHRERYKERISVEPLRKAVLKYIKDREMTYEEFCRQIDWLETRTRNGVTRTRGDTRRLTRVLGLSEDTSRGKSWYHKEINYDTAVILVRAIGHDPWEYGI